MSRFSRVTSTRSPCCTRISGPGSDPKVQASTVRPDGRATDSCAGDQPEAADRCRQIGRRAEIGDRHTGAGRVAINTRGSSASRQMPVTGGTVAQHDRLDVPVERQPGADEHRDHEQRDQTRHPSPPGALTGDHQPGQPGDADDECGDDDRVRDGHRVADDERDQQAGSGAVPGGQQRRRGPRPAGLRRSAGDRPEQHRKSQPPSNYRSQERQGHCEDDLLAREPPATMRQNDDNHHAGCRGQNGENSTHQCRDRRCPTRSGLERQGEATGGEEQRAAQHHQQQVQCQQLLCRHGRATSLCLRRTVVGYG